MRILHLLASPVFSGPAETVLELARAQRALGHAVSFAVDSKRPGLASEEPIVPPLEAEKLLDSGGLELSTHSNPIAFWQDTRRLKARELDVVHTHFSHDHWVARLGLPGSAKLVRSIHAPRSLGFTTPNAHAFTVPFEALAARIRRRPTLVLPALLPARFAPPKSRRRLREELGVSGEPLIGMISTFQPSRRHDLGLRAFALLRERQPTARMVLLGDGVLEKPLRALASQLGLGRSVTFAGYHSGERFVQILQALDEVWILGLGNDWSGRAALQARACEVRVVALAEGPLGDLADAVVRLDTPAAIRDASLSRQRRPMSLPRVASVAQQVLRLYEEAGARGG